MIYCYQYVDCPGGESEFKRGIQEATNGIRNAYLAPPMSENVRSSQNAYITAQINLLAPGVDQHWGGLIQTPFNGSIWCTFIYRERFSGVPKSCYSIKNIIFIKF
jgi:hypothetical protein